MLVLKVVGALLAFSTGGGQGNDDNGNPFLQACDALYVCQPVCPVGMTAVAPPVRSSVYHFRAVNGATTYEPDELTPFELSVTSRSIQGKRDAGTTLLGNETAKYLGILLYAVDRFENKVGRWEIPIEANARFWSPPDPGCEGRSLMHADAELKNYRERFIFRAPPPNTGPITFRLLVKQGETNKGAFYWPSAGNGDAPPAWGVAGGDLVLQERVSPLRRRTRCGFRRTARRSIGRRSRARRRVVPSACRAMRARCSA